MIPEPAAALQAMMGTLVMEIAPNMRDDYRQSSVNLLAFAAMVVAAELDRAAEVRVTENRELRALFDAAAAVIEDLDLQQRLRAAAAGRDADLRVSTLTASNNDLRRVLIELQAAVEETESPQAKQITTKIWSFLRDAAERRAIQLG